MTTSFCVCVCVSLCRRVPACGQDVHGIHAGPPRGRHGLPDLRLGRGRPPQPPGVHLHHEGPPAQGITGTHASLLMKITGRRVCWCSSVNDEWMNECLTTPQHEKQIGYWVSEKCKRMKWLYN